MFHLAFEIRSVDNSAVTSYNQSTDHQWRVGFRSGVHGEVG